MQCGSCVSQPELMRLSYGASMESQPPLAMLLTRQDRQALARLDALNLNRWRFAASGKETGPDIYFSGVELSSWMLGSRSFGNGSKRSDKGKFEQVRGARFASTETYLDLLLRDILGLCAQRLADCAGTCAGGFQHTRLLTITLLSPWGAADLPWGTLAAAPRAGFTF